MSAATSSRGRRRHRAASAARTATVSAALRRHSLRLSLIPEAPGTHLVLFRMLSRLQHRDVENRTCSPS